MNKDQIIEIIYKAFDESNEFLPEDRKLVKSLDTPIFGNNSNLDSLNLVTLIVNIESLLNESGKNIVLANEKALSQFNSPFKDASTLVDYIELILEN